MLERLLNEYQERFDESFPIFLLMGVDGGEIKKIIEDCLARGQPYEPEYEDDILY